MSTARQQHDKLFESQVFGHPAGLFVLFFTEMWERFSFYGMRVLLVNFLTMAIIGYNPGWDWTTSNATALFGTYAMMLYITPILGGIIADKLTGYNWAVVIGAAIMTLGHVCMAIETELSLYLGLGLLVVGTGFFKPNITSIISEMYKYLPEKKDGAYTIFYMGVNAGAFFGMLLCGYLAEKIGWSWGFGLAGVFMFLGTLQFWLAKPLFGKIGDVPSKRDIGDEDDEEAHKEMTAEEREAAKKPNPFTLTDKILIAVCSLIVLAYALNDAMANLTEFDIFGGLNTEVIAGKYIAILFGLAVFLYLVISRIMRYTKVIRDRMIAFIIFAFFTVLFFIPFEQAATSLIIFAREYVDRTLSGDAAIIYNTVNTLLTVIPLGIVTYVLYLLFKNSFKKIPYSNVVLATCFAIIWAIMLWMLNRNWNTTAYLVSYEAVQEQMVDEDTGDPMTDGDGNPIYEKIPVSEDMEVTESEIVTDTVRIAELVTLSKGENIHIIKKNEEATKFGYLDKEDLAEARDRAERLNMDNGIIRAEVSAVKDNEVVITVSWFSILNSFFIIVFASLFSKWWDSKYNPPAAVKYGLGLIIMAIGFGMLAWGSYGIQEGVRVTMIWLILAYLFHTLGELCLSPVGLSYVSKLVPARMIAFMFGMWYIAIAIGNKVAAEMGGQIEAIQEQYSLSGFFLIFTIFPAVAGIVVIFLHPVLKKLMHGVK